MGYAYYKDIIDVNKSVFNGDGRIVKAFIKDNVTNIGDIDFYGCDALTDVVMGNEVINIGVRAFFGCVNMTSITIPDSVTSIGNFAFRACTSLISVNIPDNITNIGYSVFDDCTSLKDYKNRYFKITNADMSCKRRHYTMDKWYYLKGEPKMCERGFHACTKPTDCLNYYYGDISRLRFFEVELGDNIIKHRDDSKVCSNKIKFIKEYTLKEFIELANNTEE